MMKNRKNDVKLTSFKGSIGALVLFALVHLSACDKASMHSQEIAAQAAAVTAQASPPVQDETTVQDFDLNRTLKPRPPIAVDYKILGTPMVGQALEIELSITSQLIGSPIQVKYQARDQESLLFMPSTSGEQSFKLANNALPSKRKIVLVPQREGRSYFTVLTQVETANGTMTRSTSIPIQVGETEPEKFVNGQLKTGSDGEVVVSMPAKER